MPGHESPCKTFWEAAIGRGLCADDTLWKATVADAMRNTRTRGMRIRWLAVFLSNIQVTKAQEILDENWEYLINEKSSRPIAQQKQHVLRRFEFILRRNGVHPSEIPDEEGNYKSACEQIGLSRPEGLDLSPDDWINV